MTGIRPVVRFVTSGRGNVSSRKVPGLVYRPSQWRVKTAKSDGKKILREENVSWMGTAVTSLAGKEECKRCRGNPKIKIF